MHAINTQTLPLIRADFNADYVPLHKHRLDFSNTQNPLGCSQRVRDLLQTMGGAITPYPDRANTELADALVQKGNLPPDGLFISNGATGCIQAALSALVGSGQTVLLPQMSFPLPIFVATNKGGAAQQVPMTKTFHIDWERMKDAITPQTAAIFLCNPNNPTGLLESPDTILAFAREVRIPVIVSEANVDFAPEISLLPRINVWPDNLIVVRSFSKAYGLAGLRVGFGVTSPDRVRRILGFRLPFSVSALSQKLAVAALDDPAHIERTQTFVHAELQSWRKELEAMGFSCLPARSNALLTRVPDGCDASALVRQLENKAITVISGGGFHPSLSDYLRLAPRDPEANRRLIEAIRDSLRDQSAGYRAVNQ